MWGEDWGIMIWGGAAAVPTLGPIGLAFLAGLLLGSAAFARRTRRIRGIAVIGLLAAALVPLVALASVELPHTFTNGTTADADEVNANFQAILDESARFHLNPSVAGSYPVPNSVIQQLCEDADGCEVVAVRAPDNGFPMAASAHLHVTVVTDPSWGFWRTRAGSSGIDGNGATELVVIADGCGLLDGASSGADPAIGWVFSAGAADCFLTIVD